MKIFNTEVYGLEQSIIRSSYPMKLEIGEISELTEKDYQRAKSLGNSKPGSGHSCYAKGIIVQCDIEAPQYFWLQWGRYHFQDIISSQSKMHKITKMNIKKQCNEYVDDRVIDVVNEYTELYNNETDKDKKQDLFQYIVSNTPSGFNLTAGITTNYLQLQTEYNQRKHHKLIEWKYFCDWCKELPMFKELMLGGSE